MKKANKLFKILCLSICVLGILVFTWSYNSRPGTYYGFLNGTVFFDQALGSEGNYIDRVSFKAETTPQWSWNKPKNFRYDYLDLKFHDRDDLTVFFPSLKCKYKGEDGGLFSKTFLSGILTPNSEADQAIVDELYKFIISAGDGTLPPPQHHSLYIESPYHGSYSHFCLGGSGLFILSGLSALAVGIILYFLGTKGEPGRFTFMSIAVLINYGFFFLGICLDAFGGFIDKVGAILCGASYIIGVLFVPIAIIYSFCRRFNSEIRKWDFLGVFISILLFFIAMLLIWR